MATINFDYYNELEDKAYSDGDIEYELLEYAKSGYDNWHDDKRWPVVYHMSYLRHNILNWFPFKKDCTILEVGSGCGALTGLLCQHSLKTVSVELTKIRAEINYHRHKAYNNLQIIVGDIKRLPREYKYDYIIVNGVLEYAAYMFDTDDPYKDFLIAAASHLKSGGRILLSIENRLGIKYFSGAKEDHTGKFFSGLNGYTDGEKVKTFSKAELCELLKKAELLPLKFFYPYPDYKFPGEIFTDETVNDMKPSVFNYPLDMVCAHLYDVNEVYQSFMKLNIMNNLSNSFFVEIGLDKNEIPCNIAYVKISANRKEEYRILTYFYEGKQKVFKKSLLQSGKTHIKKMLESGGNIKGKFKNINCGLEGNELCFPYITGVTLEDALLNSHRENDVNSFINFLQLFRDALFDGIPYTEGDYGHQFVNAFGNERCLQKLHWDKNINIDMISENIFIIDNKYEIIDYEWQMPFSIPLEFVIWRMITQFIDRYGIYSFFTEEMIYRLIDINKDAEKFFKEWNRHFAKEYVGIFDLYELSKDAVYIDLDETVNKKLQDNILISTLFFDIGNGINGNDFMQSRALLSSGDYNVKFALDKLTGIKELRWDPIEGNACRIIIRKIDTDGKQISIRPINAEESYEQQNFTFYTFDPQFKITGDFTDATYFMIDFSCEILDWAYGYQKRLIELSQLDQRINEQINVNNQLLLTLNDTNEQMNRMHGEIDGHMAINNQLTSALTDANEQINRMHGEINGYMAINNQLTSALTDANEQINHMRREIDDQFAISNQLSSTLTDANEQINYLRTKIAEVEQSLNRSLFEMKMVSDELQGIKGSRLYKYYKLFRHLLNRKDIN